MKKEKTSYIGALICQNIDFKITDQISYDIQVSSQHHRGGIGTKLVEALVTVGIAFDMEKIVLTVLKGTC